MELTQHPRTADFILSEANGTLSRENAILASSGSLLAGTVLGLVTASKKYVQWAPAATDGSETAAAILYAATNASTADAACVVVARQAEVKADALIWPAGATTPQKAAAIASLATREILSR